MPKNCKRGSVSVQKKKNKIDEITADYNRRIAALREKQISAALAVLSALPDEDE